jgi:cell division protein FtsL
MRNDKLTPYDRFIINKNNGVETMRKNESENDVADDAGEVELSGDYAEYLRGQLRRKTPSDKKVMTVDEYENYKAENETDETVPSGGAAKQVKFKKFGKLFLCAYVIIMLALALIVIVKTTVEDNNYSAGAASEAVDDRKTKIETMQDEDDSDEDDDWFDRFCDSLK